MTARKHLKAVLAAGACALALATAGAAAAQTQSFDVPAGDLGQALQVYARQSGVQIIYRMADVNGVKSRGAQGDLSADEALNQLLDGTRFTVSRDPSGALALYSGANGPQSGSAAGGGAEVEALIVTAQKREEDIQDVPIAISAFTQKDLEQQKIEGGFDLLKAIPNVTFSKNNFTSYNFSIRGIGTKAVSATTDPGVAVAFNNTALLQNRLFEQEYFDVERVEVLRGPQGTLYGRNATAGVINVISAKPDMNDFDGWVKGEVGNYHSKRVSAMMNVPLIEDKLAVRFAGALTDRQGYDFNEGTDHAVNGRDLWSARLTIGFNPTDRVRANLIWERFNEDDNRSRTGKQLCHRDNGPTSIGNFTFPDPADDYWDATMGRALFSKGCTGGSLYDADAFGTPNGLALPFVFGMLGLGGDCGAGCTSLFPLGYDDEGNPQTLLQVKDPYDGLMQSSDLRVINSFRDPIYRAKADVVELNVDVDLTDTLTFYSQTAYNKDQVYSFQDYNRFNTVPVFTDTKSLHYFWTGGPSAWDNLAPGGVFCDPQLGCSDTLAGFDISQGKGTQFSQEFRLQSDFDSAVNFSVGANYTRFKTLIDYYVFYNLITAFTAMMPFNPWQDWAVATGSPPPTRETLLTKCVATIDGLLIGTLPETPLDQNDPASICPYVDPNPIESINGEGHNYFRSKNPYKLQSYAVFGETYWQVNEALKVTAGLRYTDDRKTFTPVPSQILLASGPLAGGTVNGGYPELDDIKQHWGEVTGRLGFDWKPDLSFTDDTMLYAFYSRGYKGGGANPPVPGFGEEWVSSLLGFPPGVIPPLDSPPLELTGVDYGPTFEPEFINSYEVGAKNTLMQGALTLNLGGFFYDYKDYQVSQIKDRTAVNENFDATVWGLELESRFAPSRNLQIIGNFGYLDTKIADGETSIDIMNRTQGNEDFIVVKPWIQMPSNCIAPVGVVQEYLNTAPSTTIGWWGLCGGVHLMGLGTGAVVTDPATGEPYDPLYYNGQNGTVNINGGAGIRADLGGNELPNSPHWTANIGAQYGMDFLTDWRVTVRGDAYWQSQSWARVYNSDPYDKLHGWYNVNLSVWFEKPDQDLKIELYAKNLLDKTPITDAFLNSDDTALTTNVFVLDPRLIGLSIKKGF
ncbi:MAG TPA: TonB-dependent receptor [Caulobacteraceae bacterium]